MHVIQNRSSCRSDAARRQSNMCYKPLYARLLCLLLVSMSIITSIIPAEAAEYKPLMQDLLTAKIYNVYENGVFISDSLETARYFHQVDSAGWQWECYEDLVFSYGYITFRAMRQPDKVTVKYYSGATPREAEFVGVTRDLYQYKVPIGTNLAMITLEAFWNTSYEFVSRIVCIYSWYNLWSYIFIHKRYTRPRLNNSNKWRTKIKWLFSMAIHVFRTIFYSKKLARLH